MTKLLKITAFISIAVIVISLITMIPFLRSPEPADYGSESTEEVLGTVRDAESNSDIRIAVLNGCGREGLATLFAASLRDSGFDVVNGQGDNADSFDFDQSVVIDRKGNKKNAGAVADELGIDGVVDQFSVNPYIIEDIVVILGRDWDTLKLSKGDLSD
mgnify:CR=1 FL=1|jgi:hypothetical protein